MSFDETNASLTSDSHPSASVSDGRMRSRFGKWVVGLVMVLALVGLLGLVINFGARLPISVIEAREITESQPPVESDQWTLADGRFLRSPPTPHPTSSTWFEHGEAERPR